MQVSCCPIYIEATRTKKNDVTRSKGVLSFIASDSLCLSISTFVGLDKSGVSLSQELDMQCHKIALMGLPLKLLYYMRKKSKPGNNTRR